MVLERPATVHAERVEFESTGRVLSSLVHAELLEERTQYLELEPHGLRPVDQCQAFELRQRFAGLMRFDGGARSLHTEHSGRIDMRDVEPQARRRRIRTKPLRLGAEHRMGRTDGERVRAALRAFNGELRERRIVADTAIARTAQTVELGGDTPQRRRGCVLHCLPRIGHGIAARRRHRERNAVVVDVERVIAGFVDRRQQRGFAFRRREATIDLRTAFQFDAVVAAGFDRRRRQRDAALAFGGHQRRQLAAGQFRFERGGALAYLGRAAARQPHAFEQHGQRGFGNLLGDVMRVLPLDLKAGASSEAVDGLRASRGVHACHSRSMTLRASCVFAYSLTSPVSHATNA